MNKSDPKEHSYLLIDEEEMRNKFAAILHSRKFSSTDTDILADVFTKNSLEGVYTHGVNRFPRFIEYVDKGIVRLNGVLERTSGSGSLEQWDGGLRAGILNGLNCTEIVMELASKTGIGCVALSNTNHWMRGGTYGWKAAKAGYLFIGWTNTIANMPAWGAENNKLGNNPLVFAVPYNEEAVVLDMAMSQFSYGALEKYQLRNENLPLEGGFDLQGKMTNNPSEIIESGRILPTGYWKGAGLSLLMDIFASVLSGGLSTAEISKKNMEYGLSQVFIAVDTKRLNNFPIINDIVSQIIEDYKSSKPFQHQGEVVYPGERVVSIRNENLKNGIPVHKKVWEQISYL